LLSLRAKSELVFARRSSISLGGTMDAATVSGQKDGLRVVAYAGEHKILLAMSLDDGKLDARTNNLAGFAI
jgi:hypothetical protein